MNDLTVAKVCSTCKHAKFNSGKSWWYQSKKQMGICMLDTTGEEPPLPYDHGLYHHAAKHNEMMDLQDYFNEAWAVWYERELNYRDSIKQATRGVGYEANYFYNKANILHYATPSHPKYNQLTLEEYIDLAEQQYAAYDPFEKAWEQIERFFNLYSKFEINFEWWQANKMHMRRCHRITTCDAHEEVPRRENVAKAIANGGHQLDWIKSDK